MQAIPNEIVIGELDSPILVFDNSTIESVSEETAVSLIGDELFIDQFVPIVKYKVDNNYDLRGLPYGTKVTFYSNNRICGEFFCENVERVGKELYKINAVSAIGLMDRQRSKGGIYTGQRFDAVLREIIGEEYEFTINEDVAALQVYGWLPHSTRRKNLHQLLVAYGVNIVRNDNGGMLFTFLTDSTPQEVPSSRIYTGGKVIYDDPASRVEVTEHAYHYLSSTPEETLFDNTNTDSVSNALITFGKPIYPNSLRVLSGSLRISSSGVNHAVVSGTGVLVGKPYVHTTRVVSKDNPEAAKEKTVRLEDATLVTMVNSEHVLSRVAQYYFNAITLENSIVVDTEKCGRRYTMENAFHELTNGFISKMSTMVSSIRKATCEVIANYAPKGQGSGYTQVVILHEDSGVWKVPAEVFEIDVKSIRVVVIGSGEDGADGADGANGKEATIKDATVENGTVTAPPSGEPGAGGDGGAGGIGGVGGKVYSATIDCTGITSFEYGRNGLNTFFKGGKYSISSASGISSDTGYLEIFSGTVYALPGYAGQNGGKGGSGGIYPPPKYGDAVDAQSGEDISYAGATYKGGTGATKGATEVLVSASDVEVGVQLYFGGGGGGGAAVDANGANGSRGSAKIKTYYGYYHVFDGISTYDNGGAGANGATGNPAIALYGTGGNGGNGGGGGGGGGVAAYYNATYTTWIGALGGTGGAGGKGGAGSSGYPGCVIIYY